MEHYLREIKERGIALCVTRKNLRKVYIIMIHDNLVVVAHPDDEVLWAGMHIYLLENVDVLCCSIPRIDPIRAWRFFDVCQFLGAFPRVLPSIETEPVKPLMNLEILHEIIPSYRRVITHNAMGEYGHLHHSQVHGKCREVCEGAGVPMTVFGTGLPIANVGRHEVKVDKGIKDRAMGFYNYNLVSGVTGQTVTKRDMLVDAYSKHGIFEKEVFYDIEHRMDVAMMHWDVLVEHVRKHKWTKGVELGLRWGNCYFRVLEQCPDLNYWGVDKFIQRPENAPLTESGKETYESWPMDDYKVMVLAKARAYDGRAPVIVDDTVEAAKKVPMKSIDFVFIDADHSSEGVLRDIRAWLPKIRDGGRMFGHDINKPSVKAAVEECFSTYREHGKAWNWTWKAEPKDYIGNNQ